MNLHNYRNYKVRIKNIEPTKLIDNNLLIDEMFYDDKMTNNILSVNDDIKYNYDITKEKHINTSISISKNNFLCICFETYKSSKEIIKQFLVDLPREKIFVNNKKILSIKQIYDQFRYNNQTVIIDVTKIFQQKKAISLLLLILTLSCQSAFFPSFNHLVQKQLKLIEILESIPEYKNSNKKKYMVSDYRKQNTINFEITQTIFKCKLFASYSIINIDTGAVKFIIDSTTSFDLNNNDVIIDYCVNHGKN